VRRTGASGPGKASWRGSVQEDLRGIRLRRVMQEGAQSALLQVRMEGNAMRSSFEGSARKSFIWRIIASAPERSFRRGPTSGSPFDVVCL
jgi:hypothetical protein